MCRCVGYKANEKSQPTEAEKVIKLAALPKVRTEGIGKVLVPVVLRRCGMVLVW